MSDTRLCENEWCGCLFAKYPISSVLFGGRQNPDTN